MSAKQSGFLVVTAEDYLMHTDDNPIKPAHDQIIMNLLRQAGAPTRGTIILEPDTDNYEWACFQNNVERVVRYEWWRKVKV